MHSATTALRVHGILVASSTVTRLLEGISRIEALTSSTPNVRRGILPKVAQLCGIIQVQHGTDVNMVDEDGLAGSRV